MDVHLLITRPKMKGFILRVVISCSRMHKYGSNITATAASVSIEHGAVRWVEMALTVDGDRSPVGIE